MSLCNIRRHRGEIGIVARIPNIGARRCSQLHAPAALSPAPIKYEAGWEPQPNSYKMNKKSVLHAGNKTVDSLVVHSVPWSCHRLSYPHFILSSTIHTPSVTFTVLGSTSSINNNIYIYIYTYTYIV